MDFAELAALSARLTATKKRGEKTSLLAEAFVRAQPSERGLLALYLSGAVRQAKLYVGGAQLRALRDAEHSTTSSLSLSQVDEALAEIAQANGKGVAARRLQLLRALFLRATPDEQQFLARLILGELRQGALESLVLDALAKASEVPVALVRRAHMLAADLAAVTELAFREGSQGLVRVGVTLFRPVQPMLAEPCADVTEATAQLGRAAFEEKLDGARVQVHLQQGEVRVFTRGLNEVTDALPELVALARTLPAQSLILDGEVIALRSDGSPLPFQDTMRRFGRKLDVPALCRTLPLSTFFFDCLLCDGRSLLDAPTAERFDELARVVPEDARVRRIVTADEGEARAFMDSVMARGHEGVMAKSLTAPYAAGSRGASWLKIKRAHTLDLVVLAAEWGSGRRTGFLSNLHLGARDAENGGFVMLGKTFKGLTDELLAFQTAELLARETERDSYTVYVRPELVVEIALNGVQTSPHYPAGMALRFARVKRYRPDKTAAEADTLAEVRAVHALAHDEDHA